MPKVSQSLCKYNSRRRDIEDQLQFVDAALDLMYANIKSVNTPDESINKIFNFSSKQYPSLDCASKNAISIFNRTRKNNYEFALRRTYTHFGEYCKHFLRELYDKNPLLVVGKAPNTLQYHEIVKLGDYNLIADYMVKEVFKKLEGEKSTSKTIQKLISGTDVTLPHNVLEEALSFFEARHLIVHHSGIVDHAFFDKYPIFLRTQIKPGGKLPITLGFAKKGIAAISVLIESIDSQIDISVSVENNS